MARKTDAERLLELEKKMEQLKARKQQVESRMNEGKGKKGAYATIDSSRSYF